MYSLEKCTKFLRDHGFDLNESAFKDVLVCNSCESNNEDLTFSLSEFIVELNDCNEEKEAVVDCYSTYDKWMIEFLWNNRKEFEVIEKYDFDECAEFLMNLGYELDENDGLYLEEYGTSFFVSRLEPIVDLLNEGKFYGSSVAEAMIYNLLKNNKEKVVVYV